MKLYLSILVKFNLSLVCCQLTWFTTSSQKSGLFFETLQGSPSQAIFTHSLSTILQRFLKLAWFKCAVPPFFVRLNRKLRFQIPLDFLFWVIDGLSRPGQGLRDLSPFNSRQYDLDIVHFVKRKGEQFKQVGSVDQYQKLHNFVCSRFRYLRQSKKINRGSLFLSLNQKFEIFSQFSMKDTVGEVKTTKEISNTSISFLSALKLFHFLQSSSFWNVCNDVRLVTAKYVFCAKSIYPNPN